MRQSKIAGRPSLHRRFRLSCERHSSMVIDSRKECTGELHPLKLKPLHRFNAHDAGYRNQRASGDLMPQHVFVEDKAFGGWTRFSQSHSGFKKWRLLVIATGQVNEGYKQ